MAARLSYALDNFRAFFKRNVDLYRRKDLAVGAVGSVAYFYKAQLELAADIEGYRLLCVVKSPLDLLIKPR